MYSPSKREQQISCDFIIRFNFWKSFWIISTGYQILIILTLPTPETERIHTCVFSFFSMSCFRMLCSVGDFPLFEIASDWYPRPGLSREVTSPKFGVYQRNYTKLPLHDKLIAQKAQYRPALSAAHQRVIWGLLLSIRAYFYACKL